MAVDAAGCGVDRDRTQTGSMIPLVITAALAFLCIRHGGISMLDFLRYAAAFFFFGQQYYVWRESA